MSLEVKEEECTICLEIISPSNAIGTIQNCHHYYHEDCVLQWSSHSNSCPTCRKLFYKIEVAKQNNPKKIEKVVSIRDKLLPNDAIDQIPAEYILLSYSAHYRDNNHSNTDQITENYSSNNKLCSVCSSSDYRSSLSRNLIFCNNCPSAFHLNCLGIRSHEAADDFVWCCPMCDSHQELPIMPPFQSLVSSSRIRISGSAGKVRPKAKRIRSPRSDASLIYPHITDSIFRNTSLPSNIVSSSHSASNFASEDFTIRTNSRQRPGLVIHNENDELDDDFLYTNVDYREDTVKNIYNRIGSCSQPRINGGVILRKELKDKQNLSKEEAQSWDVFEEARKCLNDLEDSTEATSTPVQNNSNELQKRRRRKKLSSLTEPGHLKTGTSAELQKQLQIQGKQTRISSLISQVRSSSQAGQNEHKNRNETASNTKLTIQDSSAMKSTSQDVVSSIEESPFDGESKLHRKKACRDRSPNFALSLEHKIEIQKHIRNNLRPLYRPGKYNLSESPIIKSEDAYVEINKSASRKIYAHILSLTTSETDETKPSMLVNFFNQNDSRLKIVVDKFVQEELKYYK